MGLGIDVLKIDEWKEFAMKFNRLSTADKMKVMKEFWSSHDSTDRDALQLFVKNLIADFEALVEEEMRFDAEMDRYMEAQEIREEMIKGMDITEWGTKEEIERAFPDESN